MEWFSVLNHRWSGLPNHEAFFSTLKNENISAEDHQLCLNAWKENDMKTMKEVLTWYNNKDVEPMLEAIDTMFQFNQNRRIDMFPDSSWSTCSKTYQTTSLYRMRYATALTESSLAFWIFYMECATLYYRIVSTMFEDGKWMLVDCMYCMSLRKVIVYSIRIEFRTFGEFTIRSPTNQMAGFLTNEMAESIVHQPIRSQEKELIRKQDTQRNNQSTPPI